MKAMRSLGSVAVIAACLAWSSPGAAAAKGQPCSAAAVERAEGEYARGVRMTRAGRAGDALRHFEAALPCRNGDSDIFFNLVQVAEAAGRSDRVALYAEGFLFYEGGGEDARAIRGQRDAALGRLARAKRAPVRVPASITPAEATVWVDHVPVRVRDGAMSLLPGRYSVSVERAEHTPEALNLRVTAEGEARLEVSLRRLVYQGRLEVQTDPAEGVKVFVDDELVGTTPLEPLTLPSARYLVRFERPGYAMWVRYVTIERDETHTLEPVLERE